MALTNPSKLSLLYTNSLSNTVGKNGLRHAEIVRYSGKISTAQESIEKQRASGKLGFLDLPYQIESAKKIDDAARQWRGKFENFLVIGIGGSALGNIALQSALRHSQWNLLSQDQRKGWMRLFVPDNVDPIMIRDLLTVLDLRKTLVNVISKSGTTAECLANYFIVRKALESKLDVQRARKHLIFSTDPQKGYLRQVAQNEGIQTFDIPPNVGGRFSVLSPVGLLSAAATGIDILQVLAGARAMRERCRNKNVFENPAALFALIHFLFYGKNRKIHVMIPYSHQLRDMADWFRQLWAESLGKKFNRKGLKVFVGPTPVKSLGVTDQHSQIQLYIEGPQDKVLTFVSVKKFDGELTIPGDGKHYLSGKPLSKLFKAEEKATIAALSKEERPNLTISLPAVTPTSVGEFIFMLELSTAYAGELFDVNAFDQPGVEQGKILTYALMGREGFTHHLKHYKKFFK